MSFGAMEKQRLVPDSAELHQIPHVGLCIAVYYTNNQRCQQLDNDVYDSTDAERV